MVSSATADPEVGTEMLTNMRTLAAAMLTETKSFGTPTASANRPAIAIRMQL